METIKAVLVSILALVYVIPTLIITFIAFVYYRFFTKEKDMGLWRKSKFYKLFFYPLNYLEKNWFK